MPIPSSSAYDWIKTIKPEIKRLDEIPLTGSAPPFPWDQFSERLSQSFEQKSIEVSPGEIRWRTKDELYEGLGNATTSLLFAIPSLAGIAAWVMPEQEMASLESLLLTKDSHPITFQDRALAEAFYRFLALEALYNISQLHFDKSLVPILTTQTTFPTEDALCWDISITIKEHTLWGRLIISQDLRRSWVDHFSKLAQHSPLSKEIAQQVQVPLHVEVGKTTLSLQEWSEVQLGDWIALDSFSLDSSLSSGRVMLTAHGKNAFIGRLKEGNIKIVEFPLYHEVATSMAKQTENEDEFEEFDDLIENDEDFDLDEPFDNDEDLLDQDLEENLSTEESAKKEATPQAAASTENAEQTTTSRLVSKDIPVSINIEIGRIHMTMEKLLMLEPGNLLDLNIQPEDGVDLVINGQTVGKGELVRIGESIGVRILELGH